MQPEKHPVAVLFGLLDSRGRIRFGVAASLQLLERLAVTGAALLLAWRGAAATPIVFVVLGSIFFVRSAIRALLGVRARAQVLRALTAALLADRAAFADGPPPETELSFVDGVYAAESILRQHLPDLLGDIPACLLLGVLVLVCEPWSIVVTWAAVVAAGGLALLVVRGVTSRQTQRAWQAFLPALDDLLTALHGRLEVVGNGDEGRLLHALDVKLGQWELRSRGAGVTSFLAGRAPVVAVAGVAGLGLVLHGGWQSVPVAWAAVLASAVPPFAGVARATLDLGRDLVRARSVVACLAASRGVREDGQTPVSLPADLSFTTVSFSYPGQTTPSLRDINLVWHAGAVLGLAGRNGSGKSTFVQLVLALHAPTAGEIRFGGVSLVEADKASLRRRVAYLAQRPFLPDRMSVAEAIRMLAPDAAHKDMEIWLTRLGLFQVLERRNPAAPLDVKMGSLSAGEKQRVAIARVLLRDGALLLLDEPDANLDAEGIALVGEIIAEEARSRMVMVIAHNPALLARADRVVWFEDGRIRPT